MWFGSINTGQALGCVLAHSTRAGARNLKKGTLLEASDIDLLQAHGIGDVVVARLEADDVHEDAAAAELGSAVSGEGVRRGVATTGRCYLHAEHDGVLCLDEQLVDAINRVDPAVTLATRAGLVPVASGQTLATIKIIPFALPSSVLAAALALTRGRVPALRVAPYRPLRVGLVQTLSEGLRDEVLDKTSRVTEARLASVSARLDGEWRCPHAAEPLAQVLSAVVRQSEPPDVVLLVGASAIVDARDVIPAAIRAAGGRVEHLGMPVDPGNLILLGSLDARVVLGLPGCARSPSPNGLDLILQRLAAGQAVTPESIMRMGVGGLLKF